jgi:dihydroorotate dehydrogenase
MSVYTQVARPVLFALPAETAHSLARMALRPSFAWRRLGPGPLADARLAVEVHGLRLPTPIGLAPGFDKDCDLLASLMHLGFGFLAPGSVMGRPRKGNPRPRLARLVDQEAILNAMGLPSRGLEHAVERLRRLGRRRIPILVDIQGTTPDEIVANFVALQPYADAVELSLVCPNTGDTSANDRRDAVADIAARIGAARQKPVFVKIPVHVRTAADAELRAFLDVCLEHGLQGVIACGARHVESPLLQRGHGQLGGRPVFGDTIRLVERTRAHVGDRLTVIASGGISSGRDAFDALRAGASLIEIYSAFIYRGPAAPVAIARELLAVLQAEGIPSVQAIHAATSHVDHASPRSPQP